MSDFEKPTTISAAVAFINRNVNGAPRAHFGDTRERTAAIRLRVSRRSTEELEYTLKLARALGDAISTLTREEKTAFAEVTHEIRSELDSRREK